MDNLSTAEAVRLAELEEVIERSNTIIDQAEAEMDKLSTHVTWAQIEAETAPLLAQRDQLARELRDHWDDWKDGAPYDSWQEAMREELGVEPSELWPDEFPPALQVTDRG